MVPVERRIICIGPDDVLFEHQSVYRFGIKNRCIEGVEFIVYNLYRSRFPSVEIRCLSVKVRNFRINGDDRIGKLEQVGQGIDEFVLADEYIVTGTGLEPAVAVAAKQDGGS